MNINLKYLYTVWRRHLDIYCTLWKTNFIPPITEPLLFFISFGMGVGAFITYVTFNGKDVDYLPFIIPAIISTTILFQSFFECLYGSFIRLFYQNTFQALIATPVSLEEAILGDIIWAATISFINGSLVTIILMCLGYIDPKMVWPIPLYCFLNGLAYSSLGMLCTSIIQKIEQTNYPLYLIINPLFLLSGTYYPIDIYPPIAQKVVVFTPFYHTVNGLRRWLLYSDITALAQSITLHVFLFIIFSALAIKIMKRRLIP